MGYGLQIDRHSNRSGASDVKRKITGYHRDEEGDWVAHLACGHQRHVRHDPPWMNRSWVTTPEGREGLTSKNTGATGSSVRFFDQWVQNTHQDHLCR